MKKIINWLIGIGVSLLVISWVLPSYGLFDIGAVVTASAVMAYFCILWANQVYAFIAFLILTLFTAAVDLDYGFPPSILAYMFFGTTILLLINLTKK